MGHALAIDAARAIRCEPGLSRLDADDPRGDHAEERLLLAAPTVERPLLDPVKAAAHEQEALARLQFESKQIFCLSILPSSIIRFASYC